MEYFLEKLYRLGLIDKSFLLPGGKELPGLDEKPPSTAVTPEYKRRYVNLKELITRHYNEKVYHFIAKYANLDSDKTHVLSTTEIFSIEQIPRGGIKSLVNLNRINDIRRINKFFEHVNGKLPQSGIFIGCSETLELRYKKLLNKYPRVINLIILMADYILKRVMPKLPVTKKIYFKLTGGRNRIISHAETLGRLYSCGFEIIEEQSIGFLHFFAVRKTGKPAFDTKPSYGMFFPMVRTGKNGKIIRVYKFRTMYPFSEYLQQYIYEKNRLDKGGKFKNDFRVTSPGRFMRKFWIDELPMIYNFFKRDLKLVGIRPLSKQFQSLYPDELLGLRSKFRPGLIPPYYADLPDSLEEIIESEKKYLLAYQKKPFQTDWKYFWKAFVNIAFHKARSK